jgi:hypothetical protein
VISFVAQNDRSAMSAASERRQLQQEIIDWYEKMLVCVAALPPDKRASFDQWDRHRPKGVATSDWPGFATRLPKRPWERD